MKLTDAETLPCGCIVGNNGDAFVIQPCSMLCENYLYVLAESHRQAKQMFAVRDTAET